MKERDTMFCIVPQHPWKSLGGAEIAFSRLSCFLTKKFQLVVFVRDQKRYIHVNSSKSIIVVARKPLHIPFLKNFTWTLDLLCYYMLILRKKYRNIGWYVQTAYATFLTPVAILNTLSPKSHPFVCYTRGTDINLFRQHSFLERMIIKYSFLRAKLIFSLCKDMKTKIIHLNPNLERKIRVFPNAYQGKPLMKLDEKIHQIRSSLELEKGVKIILYSGRLHPIKQVDLIIKAFVKASKEHSKWHLIIIGEGEEKPKLVKLVQLLGNERIHFHERVPSNRIKYFLSYSEFIVLASRIEGFSNTLLEAIHYGIPIITGDYKCSKALIHPEKNSIVLQEINELELARAMNELIKDPEKRRNFRDYNLKLRKKFLPGNIFPEIVNYLDRIWKMAGDRSRSR